MISQNHKGLLGSMAALCLSVAAAPALAGGGLSVSPISIEFPAAGGARALEVANPGDEPIQVQVRLFDWRVDREGDHYTPSTAIGFSPPMFELAPGATQIVRLVAGAPDRETHGERAYRLFVDQLPGEAVPGQLKMPVRMVLPVFVPPDRTTGPAATADLRWRLEFDSRSGEATLFAANAGGRRVRLTDLTYRRDGVSTTIRPGLAGYVLAGQERSWTFPLPGRLGALDIAAKSDVGPLDVRVGFPPD